MFAYQNTGSMHMLGEFHIIITGIKCLKFLLNPWDFSRIGWSEANLRDLEAGYVVVLGNEETKMWFIINFEKSPLISCQNYKFKLR